MKKRLLISLIFILLISFAAANSNNFDFNFDSNDIKDLLNHLDISERDCRRSCSAQLRIDRRQCFDNYNQQRRDCNTQFSSSSCNELRGRERADCRNQMNQEKRECKGNARAQRETCLDNIKTSEVICELSCKLNSCLAIPEDLNDVDNDGIMNNEDNCPSDFNPGQNDLNDDGVGDVCADDFLCCLGDLSNNRRECFETTIQDCRSRGGAVMDCLPPEGLADNPLQELVNHSVVTFNASDTTLVALINNVTQSGVANNTYAPGTYECADFAEDLEKNLTAQGYDATWTAYWCYGGPGNPPATAHAVTDVHLSDGRTVFIEPQTGQIVSLDFDNDGDTEVNNGGYTPGQNNGQTDDNCKISVFTDRAAASAAGVPGA